MRLKHKKLLISGIAVTVAGVLGVGALLQTSVSVQASAEMMPGIEEIVKNASSDATPFRILEIVDNYSEAEIGYYISGQEPYIKLYKDKDGNSFTSLDDGLSKLTDTQTRKEFAENKKADENGTAVPTGIKDISYAAADDGPLSFSDYQEQYFTNPGNWKEVKFKNSDGSTRTEKVDAQGQYQQNPNGTGNYTKQEQTYYPIRQDADDKSNDAEKFQENIQNFFYSEGDGANAPYYIEFDKIDNATLNQMLSTAEGQSELLKEYDYSKNRYGYYENVYSNLTTDLAENLTSFPGENPALPADLVPLITIPPLREEEQFSTEENEFSTGGVVAQDTTDSGNDFSDASGFSNDGSADTANMDAGDIFSDSQQISDSAEDNTATSEPDEVSVEEQPSVDQENNTDAALDDGTQEETTTPKTLKETSKDGAVGTAADPYIYLGTTIDEYPYYSYAIVTDLKAATAEAEENEKKKQDAENNNKTYIPEDKTITIEDGQYYYWQQSGNDMVKSPLTIITGKQPVSYSEVIAHNVSDKISYNYYYRVSAVYFCCKMSDDNADAKDPENYKYYGWYYSTHPQGESTYLPVDDSNKATYYISDAEYKLTPGIGDYDFVPGTGNGTKNYKVEIDRMYYMGGYKNNDWFKKYVFHLDPDNEETADDFKNFNIEVTTLTKDEFEEKFGNQTTADDITDLETDTQFTDNAVTDNAAEVSSGENDSESQELTDGTDVQTSEVESMVSEAGVELVSIEKELSDNNTDTENGTDAEDNTDTEVSVDTADETTEKNQTGAGNTDQENQLQEFQDGSADSTNNGVETESDITAPEAEFTDDTDAFSAGDTQDSTSENSVLSEYDLIYLNGTLSADAADVVKASAVPCIVNADKAASDAEFSEKYPGFAKNDTDNHYVNDYIYFFENTRESGHTGDLLNLNFNYNFNSNSDITDGNAEIEGFEEILEYIESENQYRKLGSTEVTDGTEIQLLTTEISQARAIEYIINTKLKRTITYKKNINVLEITPDKNCEQVTYQDIYNWFGENGETSEKKNVKITKADSCCWQSGPDKEDNQKPENVLDDDSSTIWHTPWKDKYRPADAKVQGIWNGKAHENGKGHYIELTLQKVSDVSGLTYAARQETSNGAVNGALSSGTVEFEDKDGNLLKDEDGKVIEINVSTGLTKTDYRRTVDLDFGKTISGVKKIRVYFTHTLANDSSDEDQFATCSKLRAYYTTEVDYPEMEDISACHSHLNKNADNTVNTKTSQTADKMKDNDSSTIWHSPWDGEENSNGNSETNNGYTGHYITITLKNPSTINGFTYQPRQDNSSNGVLTKGVVVLSDENGKSLDTINVTTGLTDSDYKRTVNVIFGKTVSDVKTITVYFCNTLPSTWNANKFASCAEIKVFYMHDLTTNITITSMTAAEFVGHIDDFATKYDMIYISDTKIKNSSEKFLTGSDSLRYSHVGAVVAASGGHVITKEEQEKSNGGIWVEEIGNSNLYKLLGQLDNEYDDSYSGSGTYTKRFAPVSTFNEKCGGYFRGSGNDITKQQCEKLLDFVKSGYPVILASGLVNSDRSINTAEVDSASYYYEFMNAAIKSSNNVFVKSELDNHTKDITFFANLAKPVIKFTEKPKEPQRANDNSVSSDEYGNISGELKFVFSIENDSDALPAVTTYDCDLYLDLNFDGNMSSKEAQDKYIEIRDADNNVLTQKDSENGDTHYELEAGKTYTLTRKIPEDYYKLITWKLQISSNRNSYIHTSETGYAKQKRTTVEKQTIRVLQLLPNKKLTWNLATSTPFKNKMQTLSGQSFDLDFDIQVDTQTIDSLVAFESKDDTKKWKENTLNNYQMLILGFADTYQDIPNKYGQVDAILDFIRSGKSVIFAHDTTSYVNYNYSEMYPNIVQTQYGENEDKCAIVYYDRWLQKTMGNPTWGLSLNQVLRSVVGMDRYGITSDYKISSEQDSPTIGDILKRGNELTKDNSAVSFETLMKVAGDIAYQTGGNRTSSYAQTQSYTNALLNEKKLGGDADTKVNYATKVNDGAITQYPYVIGDTISVAVTHGQYYQLALEQDYDTNSRSDGETDVVVWYCLGGNNGNSIYDKSPNDARNNYYLYSKGNVIYTGAGHSDITDANKEEINLFINAIVAAANVAAAAPEVTFVKSLNPAAEIENTRYYMTDQESWTSSEQNVVNTNMDFFVNVRDYNMVSLDLTQGDLDNQEMTLDFYIENPNGEETITVGGENIKVTNLNASIGALKIYGKADRVINRGPDGSFHFTDNNAYGFNVENIEQYLRDRGGTQNDYYANCKIYAKVSSSVSIYGTANKKESWSSINLKQRQFFDLD